VSGATRLTHWTERTQLLRWALLPGLVCAVGALSTIAVVIVWNHEWSRTARACDPRHIDFEPASGLPGLLHTSLAVLVAGLVAAATALIYVTYRSARQRGRVMDWEPTIVATVLIVGLLALVYGISSSSDMPAGGETCFA
jgi:multisubunit Na+/H+ antiporter MnhB subunit